MIRLENYLKALTVLGGAKDINDIRDLISKHSLIGAGAGSAFVFKGKYKAVLINYPSAKEKFSLIKKMNSNS